MWIGYDDLDRLITYPDAHNLSGCSQPIHMRSLIHPTWPILAVVTRRACGLATTPPQVTPLLPPIGEIAPLEPRHAADTPAVSS